MWQLTSVEDMRNNVEALEKVSAALEEARLECEDINREEELFEWEMTQFPQLDAMMQAKDPYEKLWTTAYHYSVISEQWLYGNEIHVSVPFEHSKLPLIQHCPSTFLAYSDISTQYHLPFIDIST